MNRSGGRGHPRGWLRDTVRLGELHVDALCGGARNEQVVGYSILSVAAGEAHILNLCIDVECRALGYGERLLDEMLYRARSESVREIFLEVRPSNQTALGLYKKKGFHKIAERPAYYQANDGREDAAVLAKKLVSD